MSASGCGDSGSSWLSFLRFCFTLPFCDLKSVTWYIFSIKSTARLDKTLPYRNPDAASNLNCTEYILTSCSPSAIKEIAVDILIAAFWQKRRTPVDRLAQNSFKREPHKSDKILLRPAPPQSGYRQECPAPQLARLCVPRSTGASHHSSWLTCGRHLHRGYENRKSHRDQLEIILPGQEFQFLNHAWIIYLWKMSEIFKLGK